MVKLSRAERLRARRKGGFAKRVLKESLKPAPAGDRPSRAPLASKEDRRRAFIVREFLASPPAKDFKLSAVDVVKYRLQREKGSYVELGRILGMSRYRASRLAKRGNTRLSKEERKRLDKAYSSLTKDAAAQALFHVKVVDEDGKVKDKWLSSQWFSPDESDKFAQDEYDELAGRYSIKEFYGVILIPRVFKGDGKQWIVNRRAMALST